MTTTRMETLTCWIVCETNRREVGRGRDTFGSKLDGVEEEVGNLNPVVLSCWRIYGVFCSCTVGTGICD